MQRVGAELYVELQQFYARQMPLLEARRFPEFLATFTEDGSVEHQPNGWKLEGRAQILTEMQARRGEASQPLVGEISPRDAREGNVPYYNGIVYRYWFDRMSVEPVGDELRVGYLAVMSMTDAKGKVSFEPTTTVQDVLVRVDGELYTRSRVVTHDSPNWADKIHNPS
jgi:actinorhodin biosynthesis protein ActVIA